MPNTASKTATPEAAAVEEDREVWEDIMVVEVNGGQPYKALQKLELIEKEKKGKGKGKAIYEQKPKQKNWPFAFMIFNE